MKKLIVPIFIFVLIVCFFSISLASSSLLQYNNTLEHQTQSELVDIKEKAGTELQKYEELYGSKSYGMVAYILDKIRFYSIPLCFLGIAIGTIYKYVLGIRRIDMSDKGFALLISFVTILVICQVLPLIFAIVVQGWRG